MPHSRQVTSIDPLTGEQHHVGFELIPHTPFWPGAGRSGVRSPWLAPLKPHIPQGMMGGTDVMPDFMNPTVKPPLVNKPIITAVNVTTGVTTYQTGRSVTPKPRDTITIPISSPQEASIMPAPLALIALNTAMAMRAAGSAGVAAAPFAGFMGTTQGRIIGQLLAASGIDTVAGWAENFLGIDIPMLGHSPETFNTLVEEIDAAIAGGTIDLPGPRRDGTNPPPIAIVVPTDGGLNRGKPFGIRDYFSRNFVAAVRKDERTPRYRGRPRARRGSSSNR